MHYVCHKLWQLIFAIIRVPRNKMDQRGVKWRWNGRLNFSAPCHDYEQITVIYNSKRRNNFAIIPLIWRLYRSRARNSAINEGARKKAREPRRVWNNFNSTGSTIMSPDILTIRILKAGAKTWQRDWVNNHTYIFFYYLPSHNYMINCLSNLSFSRRLLISLEH